MLKLQGGKPKRILKQEKEEEKPIMKKFTMLLALALVLSLTIGVAVAMAAPGDYNGPADYANGKTPSDAVYEVGTNLETGEVAVDPAKVGTYTGTNANQSNTAVVGTTGESETVINRAYGDLYIHGQFKKATNACASCHMTHTAAGDSLLIQNGIYNTCTACHDGTLGKLNVFDVPTTPANPNEVLGWTDIGGGTFGGAFNATENASMHMPTGALQVAAAPGGNRQDFGTDLYGNIVDNTSWTAEFSCASCHQPHGSYSDRLLDVNPANIGRLDVQVYDWWETDAVNGVWNAVYDDNGNGAYDAGTDVIVTGPWSRDEVYKQGETQTVVFKDIYEGDLMTQGIDDAAGKLGMLPNNKQYHEFAINYSKGYGQLKTGTDITGLKFKIAVVPAVVARVAQGTFVADNDISSSDVTVNDPSQYVQGLDGQILKWTGSQQASVNPKSNYTLTGITWFCAGCHTDYYADKFEDPENTGADVEGRYTTAYRHTINRGALGDELNQQFVWESGKSYGYPADTLTCLSCHYAHGTTQQIMRNADDTQAVAADVNPSSAIKRYVNMAVCYKCHTEQKNAAFINDPYYYDGGDVNAIQDANGAELIPTAGLQ